MTDTYDGPFAGVADVTEIVSAAAQTAILAEVDKVLALIPDITDSTPGSQAVPDFDLILPATAVKLRAEFAALKSAIDAAPTS